MRPLTDDEMKKLFEKLQIFIGPNISKLIDRTDEPHTFRLIKDRVFYISESQMKLSTNIARDMLMSIGVCFGKFTKSGKFKLHITSLDYLAQYAIHKIWIKTNSEMSFLYGNNITKSGLLKMTDNIPQYAGVIVYNTEEIVLGFGLSAQPTEYIRDLEPTAVVLLHQSDIGEYLRIEDNIV